MYVCAYVDSVHVDYDVLHCCDVHDKYTFVIQIHHLILLQRASDEACSPQ